MENGCKRNGIVLFLKKIIKTLYKQPHLKNTNKKTKVGLIYI